MPEVFEVIDESAGGAVGDSELFLAYPLCQNATTLHCRLVFRRFAASCFCSNSVHRTSSSRFCLRRVIDGANRLFIRRDRSIRLLIGFV